MITIICDVCGEPIPSIGGQTPVAGTYVSAMGPEGARVQKMFGKIEFNICLCCTLKSMGVKPVPEVKEKKKK